MLVYNADINQFITMYSVHTNETLNEMSLNLIKPYQLKQDR